MAQLVKMGALIKCAVGSIPTTLVVTPENTTNAVLTPAATIMDFIPMKNILPFGICAYLTSQAGLPIPCVPVVVQPWTPGSPTVLIKGKPALNNTSIVMCKVFSGGIITIQQAGQFTVNVP